MHIEADALTLPELALLLHHELIFSGKMLMDHNATIIYNNKPKMSSGTSPPGIIKMIKVLLCTSLPFDPLLG
jgi:hypothetical protein